MSHCHSCKSSCHRKSKCCEVNVFCPPSQIGPVGPQGPTGSQGPTGNASGSTGPTGPTGPDTVPVGNTVFVDAVFGKDSTGVRQEQLRPFLTLDAAAAAALPGDLVQVRPGSYVALSNLVTQEGMSWYLEDGVNITTSITLFDSTGFNTFTVDGLGSITSSSATPTIILGAALEVVKLLQINSSQGVAVQIQGGESYLEAKLITTLGATPVINISKGLTTIRVERILNFGQTTASIGINIDNTTSLVDAGGYFYADELFASGGIAYHQKIMPAGIASLTHINIPLIHSTNDSAIVIEAGSTFINSNIIHNESPNATILHSDPNGGAEVFMNVGVVFKFVNNGPLISASSNGSLLSGRINQLGGGGSDNSVQLSSGIISLIFDQSQQVRFEVNSGVMTLYSNALGYSGTSNPMFLMTSGELHCTTNDIQAYDLFNLTNQSIFYLTANRVSIGHRIGDSAANTFLRFEELNLNFSDTLTPLIVSDHVCYFNTQVLNINTNAAAVIRVTNFAYFNLVSGNIDVNNGTNGPTFLSLEDNCNCVLNLGDISHNGGTVINKSAQGNLDAFIDRAHLNQNSPGSAYLLSHGSSIMVFELVTTNFLANDYFIEVSNDAAARITIDSGTISSGGVGLPAFVHMTSGNNITLRLGEIDCNGANLIEMAASGTLNLTAEHIINNLDDSLDLSSIHMVDGSMTVDVQQYDGFGALGHTGGFITVENGNFTMDCMRLNVQLTGPAGAYHILGGTNVIDVDKLISTNTILKIDAVATHANVTINTLNALTTDVGGRFAEIDGGGEVMISGFSRNQGPIENVSINTNPDQLTMRALTMANRSGALPANSITAVNPVFINNYGILNLRTSPDLNVTLLNPDLSALFVNVNVT